MKRFSLISHPVRLRIAQLLYGRQLTTTQIAAAMPDVPKASLYRHVQRLLEGEVITVVETHLVKGIEERVYTTVKSALHLTAEDRQAGIDVDEFADFIRIYGALAVDDMATYVASHPQLDVNVLAFRDYDFYATDEEFTALRDAIWRLLNEAQARSASHECTARRLLVLSFPAQESQNDQAK